jgi:Tol biopolymer transport system component
MVEKAAPGISSVEPDSGTVGTEVTITGMNFSSNAAEVDITFDGTSAPVNGAAQDQLITEVPQSATDGPIEVTIKQKSATGPDFDVITEGTMEVITSTSGSDQDSDGYTITVDGSTGKSASKNDTKHFTNLGEGSHDTELSGITGNCSVTGDNPKSVSITAGDTTSTTFSIECLPVASNQIAFVSDRDGDREVFVMNADGSGQQNLSDLVSVEYWPVISHDGTGIAFYSQRNSQTGDLFVMNVDGSNVRQITNSGGAPQYYSWSPDDSKIVFQDDRGSNNDEIFVINADGSGLTQLTDDASRDQYPSWSPDGNKIAFASDRDGDFEIYTINADGSNLQKLTDNTSGDLAPRWSPDGSKIVFNTDRDGNQEIYTIDADGSNPQRITNNSASDQFATWSPNGSELVFQTDRDGTPKYTELMPTVRVVRLT